MTTRDGHPELYLMNPDGSNVVRLTYNNAISVGFPAWSRDGAHIAFNCEVENGNGDLCTIKPDGTDFVRLTTDPCYEFGPTWSPDSQNIAFLSCQFEIAVMNADGTNVRPLGVGVASFSRLVWSPDGAQIAFGNLYWPSPTAEDGYIDIYLMQADGTNVRTLGLGSYSTWADEPAWMPVQVPIASLTFMCNGLTCSFDASGSSDPYATITSYEWDFGDQTTGRGATVSHLYASGAPYTAKLTVKDSNGATGTKFQTIPANPPDAVIQGWCNGHTLQFRCIRLEGLRRNNHKL
jgi:Tol biopolymer transport system component